MYGDFSYIYDKLSFDIDYKKYADNIKYLINKYGIEKNNMLELAAGSGMLTNHFFDEFKSIDAVDFSIDMLNVFKNKYSNINVNLLYYNMVEFENSNAYDIIVILLDSINYVTDPQDLRKLFLNSYNNLKEGGLLIFDINSEYKMNEIFGSNCFVYEYEDIFYTWDNFLEDELIDMYLNFFVKQENDEYRRIEEYQQQRIYTVEFIKEMILEIGFDNIEAFDEDTMGVITEDTMRILFSTRKEKYEQR